MTRRLTPVDWRTLVKVFQADGFQITRQEGSHIALTKPGVPRPVIIQQGKEIPVFIIQNNLRTAGVSRERYFELLDKV